MGGGINYSTEEQVVGTWIDGSTLYQKTFDCGAMPNSTYKYVETGLSNVLVVNMFGVSVNTSDETNTLPSSNFGTINYDRGLAYKYTNNTISLYAGYNRSNEKAYVTLQYTKTTD